MDVLLDCLSDENVEVREMSSKTLSGVVRCSQRQNIIPLKVSEEASVLIILNPADLESLHIIGTQCKTTLSHTQGLWGVSQKTTFGDSRPVCPN